MATSQFNIAHASQRANVARASLLPLLVAATTAIGLAGCGGSGHSQTTAAVQPLTVTITTPTATTQPAATARPTRRSSAPAVAQRQTVTTSKTITIPDSPAAPKYVGPSPVGCLTAAGLIRAQASRQPEVWEAYSGLSSDHTTEVFLSGPYKTPAMATRYAQSLKVVEISASHGRWVASAALRSGLETQLDKAAACMGEG
jgi:hypothetical protein